MSWQRTVLGVVIAASGSLCGCVLQGDRHENEFRDELCALAEEAAESCESAVEYTPDVTEEGKLEEPPPTAVKSPEQVKFDCASSQIRLGNLCGPELDAFNACVLDHLDTSVVAQPSDSNPPEGTLRFVCAQDQVQFDDPGQLSSQGKKVTRTVYRYTITGDVQVQGLNGACIAERQDIVDCAAGR